MVTLTVKLLTRAYIDDQSNYVLSLISNFLYTSFCDDTVCMRVLGWASTCWWWVTTRCIKISDLTRGLAYLCWSINSSTWSTCLPACGFEWRSQRSLRGFKVESTNKMMGSWENAIIENKYLSLEKIPSITYLCFKEYARYSQPPITNIHTDRIFSIYGL